MTPVRPFPALQWTAATPFGCLIKYSLQSQEHVLKLLPISCSVYTFPHTLHILSFNASFLDTFCLHPMNIFSCFSYCRLERMMYICKDVEFQAIWQIMSQRMNTNMKTNTKTDQILRPSDSLQTIEKKHGKESKTWCSLPSWQSVSFSPRR